jgi:hypothetical protein
MSTSDSDPVFTLACALTTPPRSSSPPLGKQIIHKRHLAILGCRALVRRRLGDSLRSGSPAGKGLDDSPVRKEGFVCQRQGLDERDVLWMMAGGKTVDSGTVLVAHDSDSLGSSIYCVISTHPTCREERLTRPDRQLDVRPRLSKALLLCLPCRNLAAYTGLHSETLRTLHVSTGQALSIDYHPILRPPVHARQRSICDEIFELQPTDRDRRMRLEDVIPYCSR